jgi:hypothetical protein
MTDPSQHVIPHEGAWAVRNGSDARPLRRFEQKGDAIRYARAAALQLGADLVIYRLDGSVQTRDHYGPPAAARRPTLSIRLGKPPEAARIRIV